MASQNRINRRQPSLFVPATVAYPLAGCLDRSGPVIIFAAVLIAISALRMADASVASSALLDEPQVVVADHSHPSDFDDPVAMSCRKSRNGIVTVAATDTAHCRSERLAPINISGLREE